MLELVVGVLKGTRRTLLSWWVRVGSFLLVLFLIAKTGAGLLASGSPPSVTPSTLQSMSHLYSGVADVAASASLLVVWILATQHAMRAMLRLADPLVIPTTSLGRVTFLLGAIQGVPIVLLVVFLNTAAVLFHLPFNYTPISASFLPVSTCIVGFTAIFFIIALEPWRVSAIAYALAVVLAPLVAYGSRSGLAPDYHAGESTWFPFELAWVFGWLLLWVVRREGRLGSVAGVVSAYSCVLALVILNAWAPVFGSWGIDGESALLDFLISSTEVMGESLVRVPVVGTPATGFGYFVAYIVFLLWLSDGPVGMQPRRGGSKR